jgi:UrcA family protein
MKTILFFTAFAAVAFPQLSQAQSVRCPMAVTVSSAGLDLGTRTGERLLDLRILHAASRLCGTPSSADLRGRVTYKHCRAEVRRNVALERDRIIASARARAGVEVAAMQ